MKPKVQTLLDNRGIAYDVWSSIPEDRAVSQEDAGKKVWVAGFKQSERAVLKKVHAPGSPLWPEGGATVSVSEDMRFFLLNQVMLHPELFIVPKVKKKRGRKKKNA